MARLFEIPRARQAGPAGRWWLGSMGGIRQLRLFAPPMFARARAGRAAALPQGAARARGMLRAQAGRQV